MTIEDLKTFICVAETENLSKASRFLNMTESALSKTVKRTEKEIGFDLFSREKNRLHLTEKGKVAFDKAQKIIMLWNELLKERSYENKKKIRIFSTDVCVLQNLSSHLVYLDVENKYSLDEKMTSKESIKKAFEEGNCDVAVTLSPLNISGTVTEVFNESLVVVCKKGLLKTNKSAYISELDINELIFIEQRGPISVSVEKAIKKSGKSIDISYQLDSVIFFTKLYRSNVPAIMTITAASKLDTEKYDIIELLDEELKFPVYVTVVSEYKEMLAKIKAAHKTDVDRIVTVS